MSGPGGLEVGHAYDGAGNRVEKTVNGVRTVYRVDPFSPVDNVPQVLVEETGGEAVRYLYGLDLLGEVRAGTPTYYGYDALSIRLGLGEGGALTACYRYAPFGEVEGEGPAGYGFTGERWDGKVGLLYLRARYYRPAVGRFVSRDTFPVLSNQSQEGNRYIWGNNNPICYRDSGGLFPNPSGCGLPLCEWIEPPRWWDNFFPIQVVEYSFNSWAPSTWQNRPLFLSVEWLPERYTRVLGLTNKKICIIYEHCQRTGLDPLLMLSILAAEGTGSFDTCNGGRCSPEFFDVDTRRATNLVHRLIGEWWSLSQAEKEKVGQNEPPEDSRYPLTRPWEGDWIYYLNWGEGTLESPPIYRRGYAEDPNWQYNVRAEYKRWLQEMHIYRRLR